MTCPNCGNTLSDEVRFCHHCGYSFQTETAYIPEETPVKKKKMKKPVIISICAGALVLIALAAVLLGGFFSGPEGKVLQAAGKSVQAYQEVLARLPLAEPADTPAAAHHSAVFALEQLPQLPMMEGMGLEVDVNADFAGRMLDMTLAPSLGSFRFLETTLRVDGTTLYAAMPDLLGERILSADTTKAAQTLQNLGVELDEEMSGLHFDLFEVLDILRSAGKTDTAVLAKAAAELGKAVTAQKLGKETMTINGTEKNCENYLLVIPQQALADFFDTIDTDKALTLAEQLTEATGVPVHIQEDTTAADLQEVLHKLGDIQLNIAICDGYIASVLYKGTFEDENEGIFLSLSAQFGGSKEYADDLTVQFAAGDNVNVTITSSGDHTCSSGSFTDVTTFHADGETVLKSQLSYTPEGKEDNFSWTLTTDGAVVEISGQIDIQNNEITTQQHLVSLFEGEEKIVSFSMQLSKDAYTAPEQLPGDVLDLTTITQDQLEAELQALSEDLFIWLLDLLSQDNPIADLVSSLLGI